MVGFEELRENVEAAGSDAVAVVDVGESPPRSTSVPVLGRTEWS